MKYNFVKCCAITPNLRVADIEFNKNEIINEIKNKAENQVEILVFPELSLCGATCGDIFLQPFFIDSCKKALKDIVESTIGINMLIFVGLPIKYNGNLYNCAAVINNGKVVGIVPQTYIPKIDDKNKSRYFVPAPSKNIYEFYLWDNVYTVFGKNQLFSDKEDSNIKIKCEINEDLIYNNIIAPITVNLFSKSEFYGMRKSIRSIIEGKVECYKSAYVLAGAGKGESTTDGVYSGLSIIAEYGNSTIENDAFSGKEIFSEIDLGAINYSRDKLVKDELDDNLVHYTNFINNNDISERTFKSNPFIPNNIEDAELLLNIQANALARRLEHTHAKKAVLGISGGLDSTLALLVCVRACKILNKSTKDIVAITMPGFGTSGKTFNNSKKLIELSNATSLTVDITESVSKHFSDIAHDKDTFDVTYENAQARMRTMILMDKANQENGIVIGTGDLSEAALGWCTYNGDHMSMYGVNAGVPKTLVYFLVDYERKRLGGEIGEVLQSILDTDISPELLPPDKQNQIQQKTEDLIGPYELHDFYLYRIMNCGDSPERLYYIANYTFKNKYNKETIKKWIKNFYKRFYTQQFKRSSMPDGVKVCSVSLSQRTDCRLPSDSAFELWLKTIDKFDSNN